MHCTVWSFSGAFVLGISLIFGGAFDDDLRQSYTVISAGSGGVGKVDAWDAGLGDSLLRRLCLEAVAVGDHTSFGQVRARCAR